MADNYSGQKRIAQFDYEWFPRGRVWMKEGKACIFLNPEINIPTVVDRINEVFKLNGEYTVYEDGIKAHGN